MKEIERTKSVPKSVLFIGGLAFTMLGFIFLPSILHIYQNKAYKAILRKNKIAFDHLEPEIIYNPKRKD